MQSSRNVLRIRRCVTSCLLWSKASWCVVRQEAEALAMLFPKTSVDNIYHLSPHWDCLDLQFLSGLESQMSVDHPAVREDHNGHRDLFWFFRMSGRFKPPLRRIADGSYSRMLYPALHRDSVETLLHTRCHSHGTHLVLGFKLSGDN
jgi:hypothetical protein